MATRLFTSNGLILDQALLYSSGVNIAVGGDRGSKSNVAIDQNRVNQQLVRMLSKTKHLLVRLHTE